MDSKVIQQFEQLLEYGWDDLALQHVERYDQESLRLLWHLPDMPEEVVIPDEALVRLLDSPTWTRLSKRLHYRVTRDIFAFTSMSLIGGLVTLGGGVEVIDIAQSGRDYLPEPFCMIPIGILFLLVGGFFLYNARRELQGMQSPMKKKNGNCRCYKAI
jgi:hypothetical protein